MIDHNKNFDNETHCYFNENTQEWIPYYQLKTYTKKPFSNELQTPELPSVHEDTLGEWGTMSNKEIKEKDKPEQLNLF